MASPAPAKKQLIDSIKDKTNILVTVSRDPSVDELAAALGLTIFLNKLGKHATAVASGTIPSAIDFLQPDKTFEATADSLRDFIIALDKEKADHLRYKLEGDVVKIFITPYRTTITDKDLEFSQGDYNVELVIALNVANNDELDKALSAHGKILHNATVVTVTAGSVKSQLGSLEWHEDKASGVSEMIADLLQELKTAKAALDEQMSTALLTGIVAATERFSNDATSPRVMTTAADLMASGANQQLIATKLEEAEEAEEAEERAAMQAATPAVDGSMRLMQGQSSGKLVDDRPPKVSREAQPVTVPDEVFDEEMIEPEEDEEEISYIVPEVPEVPELPKESVIEPDGTMKISHVREGDLDDVAQQVMRESQKKATKAAEEQLDELMQAPAPEPADDLIAELRKTVETPQSVLPEVQDVPPLPEIPAPAPSVMPPQLNGELLDMPDPVMPEPPRPGVAKVSAPSSADMPSIGGTLNATAEEAAEEERRRRNRNQNKTILTHGAPLGSAAQDQNDDAGDPVLNAAMSLDAAEPMVTDVFATPPNGPVPPSTTDVGDLLPPAPAPAPVALTHQDALAGVQAVFAAGEAAPAEAPQFPTAPPVHETMQAPAVPPAPFGLDMPDFSALPPLPTAPIGVDPNGLPPVPVGVDPGGLPTVPQASPAPNFNPGQFQIPPQ